MQNEPKKIYFENLNAIRFIASFGVLVCHVEGLKTVLKLKDNKTADYFEFMGYAGVLAFFVLSGFLITYLLLEENKNNDTINFRAFYKRRIFRIFPLYFLLVFLSFFVLPFISFMELEGFERAMMLDKLAYKLLFFVLFLPHFLLYFFGALPYVSPTWTIGVEENFYLIWPWLILFIKNKWVLMSSVILGYMALGYLLQNVLFQHQYVQMLSFFWVRTPIQCLAIGGLFAVIIFDTSKTALFIQKIIFYKTVQWLTLCVLIFLIYKAYEFPYFYHEIYAILFGILICNFAYNKNRIFSMEYPILDYLGKISYGFYMYHSIVIVFCIRILQMYGALYDIILYPVVFLLSALIASISYEYFEKPLIHFGRKNTVQTK